MKKRISSVLLVLAVVLAAVGGIRTYTEYQKRAQAQKEYESLAQMAKETEPSASAPEETASPEETKAPYESPINWEELRAINPDVVGWIKIDGTKIDYPIVYTDNNEKYLDTDFEGKKSVAGSIYLDFESEPDFSGKHNIIYGHHMRNGTMFKDIVNYKEESFFKEHQNIVVYTPEREYQLRPVAALYSDASGIRRKTMFNSEESFQGYVDEMTRDCTFKQLPGEPMTRLWSFITCSYEFNDARTILYACEVPEGDEASEQIHN